MSYLHISNCVLLIKIKVHIVFGVVLDVNDDDSVVE